MKVHRRLGVAVLSLSVGLIAAAVIVIGVLFGIRGKSEDGQKLPVFFTISFETFGAAQCAPISGEAGREIEFPICVREGCEFGGWFSDADFKQPAPERAPAENAVYYAKFEKLYSVSFVIGEDTVTVRGKAGEGYEIPNPVKEKAEFDGWYSDGGFLQSAEPNTVFTDDETYYAKFVPVYTVRYLDGDRELLSVTGRAGSGLPPLSPEKQKSAFDGWFADGKLTEPAEPSEIPDHDAVYYAKFSPLFTVTFFTGESGIFSVTGRAGSEFSVPDPSYTGWEFKGWYADDARLLPTEPPLRIPARDTNFYAKYEKLITLCFDTDGGTEILPVTAVLGTVLAIDDPTKEGYEFEGWTLKRGGTEFVSVTRMPDADATYYAKFAKLFHVIFESEGRETARVTGKTGTPYSAPTVAAPAGHVFLGWKSGETLAEFPAKIGMGDIVYRAAFGEIPVLRFYANPPEGKDAAGSMAAVTGIYGQSVSVFLLQNAFSVSGFRFAGWSESAQGKIRYRDGEEIVFSESVSLYARWAREYTSLGLSGVRVYYCEGNDTAALAEQGNERIGGVRVNAIGEREFEIGGYAGRLNTDGTFTPRQTEYGVYDAGGGCELFLSGYGTALLSGARTDEGVYKIEMGNLLFFQGKSFEATYRIENNKTVLYVDNTAVFGCYYDAAFTAFVLGESARFGGETGLYVAGNGTISFYFGGEETRAVYSEADGYFLYCGAYFYRAAEKTEFTGEGVTLALESNGSYPASALLNVAGEPLRAGELTESDGGLFLFVCKNGADSERYSLRLSYGGRVARVEIVQSETQTVWRNGSDPQDGTLYVKEVYDYEKGRRVKTLRGEVKAADENLLVLPEREFSDPDADDAEYSIDRNGVTYRLRVTMYLSGSERCFRCEWYGILAAELVSPCGEYRIVFEQFAGSEGIEEYEGLPFGELLSFRFYAGETLPDLQYAFPLPNGAALFHVFSGEFTGQYRVRFSFGGGLLVGFSCEKKEILQSGNYVFVRNGDSFESLYDRNGEAFLIPLLDIAPLCEGVEIIRFGETLGACLEFAYGREPEMIMRCVSRTYRTNGFTVNAVVGAEGERVYTVRVSEGDTDLGNAEPRGGIWVAESEFSRVEIAFSEGCAEATAEWVKKIFTAEDSQTGIALSYTLNGAEELGEIVSVSCGEFPLTLGSCELLELGGSSGYYVCAADSRGDTVRFIFRLSDGTAAIEEAKQYTAQDGNAQVSIVYGDGWYFVLPVLELYSEYTGNTARCNGTLARESENAWALRAGGAGAVQIEVTRKSNLLAPFSVTVHNLPELITGDDENGDIFAEAAVLFGENGNLSVFYLRTEGGEFSPREEEIVSLGGGRWYFSDHGLILNAEEGLAYFERCENVFSLVCGEFTVEIAEAGFYLLPVRFSVNGVFSAGTFTELSYNEWLWEGNGERYALVFTEDYGGFEVSKR